MFTQTSFNFPFIDNYLDEDFLISKENSKAFAFISNYHNSHKANLKNIELPRIFVIYGKESSGKTHLSHIWRRKISGEFLFIENLQDFEIANHIEKNKAYIIENIDEIKNEIALFHIFNIILEKNCFLMLTSNINLNLIKFNLADLSSRLKNIFTIEIKDPDIDLIKMLLTKYFAAKQLLIEDKVMNFLANNIDRNYKKIAEISKLLEFYCFEEKRKITIPFIDMVLQKQKINNFLEKSA